MKNFYWDGHTHSQFCPHGTGDRIEDMIEKAISLGFTHYSITEHAPLPSGLMENQQLQDELVISQNDLEEYFLVCGELKSFYKDKIQILIGLEVDYLVHDEDYTRDFLNEYGPRLDDSLLSLHLIPGKNGYRALDYTPEDFDDGLTEYYGDLKLVHKKYWEVFCELIESDLGPFKPSRIGHINLINKFIKVIPLDSLEQGELDIYIKDVVFPAIDRKKMSLDYNVAGLAKDTCGEIYLTESMLGLCKDHNIPLVYGSDAHGVKAVGHFYNNFPEFCKSHSITTLLPDRSANS